MRKPPSFPGVSDFGHARITAKFKQCTTISRPTCRPKPVSAAEKAAVVESLPAHGAVTQLGAGERRKVDAIIRVLRAHERGSVYDVRVITAPQAWTGLHARAVLLISLPALTLINSEELQALVAHEIGHEYVWLAVRTLTREGVSPERLQTATEKVAWYNRERPGGALDEGNYPSLKESRQLIKKMSLVDRQ